MATKANTRINGHYYNVLKDRFSYEIKASSLEEAQKQNPQATARTNKNGRTVFEVTTNEDGTPANIFVGTIRDLFIKKDGDFGHEIKIVFDDGIVSLGATSNAGRMFLKVVGNADVTKELDLILKYEVSETDPTKGSTSLFIAQDGKSVPFKYTKAVPNGLPEPVDVVINGSKQKDYTAQVEFLEENVIKPIVAVIKGAAVAETPAVTPAQAPAYPAEEIDVDDIPF